MRRRTYRTCSYCGTQFSAVHKETQLCSQSCVNRVRRRPSLEQRFHARVSRAGDDDCWLWTGPGKRRGYGSMKWSDGRYHGAHRIAFAIANGFMPSSDLHVCHKCDNPPCCNPKHLWVGDAQANVSDRDAKKRTSQGEAHYAAKLTRDAVLSIRTSTNSASEIARLFGVSLSHVRRIQLGKKWKGLLANG